MAVNIHTCHVIGTLHVLASDQYSLYRCRIPTSLLPIRDGYNTAVVLTYGITRGLLAELQDFPHCFKSNGLTV